MSIESKHDECEENLTARYVNGLNYLIQYEISMHYVKNVDEVYQLSLRDKEKLARNIRKIPFVVEVRT